MFNSLSLFSSISLGCSIGYGLGGASRQIEAKLAEKKEHITEKERSFFFTDRDKNITITHRECDSFHDQTIVNIDGKKYIFDLKQRDSQVIATCNLLHGVSFVYILCGDARVLCSQISANGRCFISVDTVSYGGESGLIDFKSFGMTLSEEHANWKRMTSFMKNQLVIAFLLHEYDQHHDFGLIDAVNYKEVTALVDYCNGLLLFDRTGQGHAVCVRGCLNHSVDILCGGGIRDCKRYNMILPDRYDRNTYTVTRWIGNEEKETFDIVIADGMITVLIKPSKYEFRYSISKDNVVFNKND